MQSRQRPPLAQPRTPELTYFVILSWQVAACSLNGQFVDKALGTERPLETPGGKWHPGESPGNSVQNPPRHTLRESVCRGGFCGWIPPSTTKWSLEP